MPDPIYDSIELDWRDIKDTQPLSREKEVAYFKFQTRKSG